MVTKKMKYYINIEEKKYKKGDNMVMEEQDIVPYENGQAIKISIDSKKTLSVIECEAKILINNCNKLLFYLLFIFIFFN